MNINGAVYEVGTGEGQVQWKDGKWVSIDEAAEYLGIKTVTLRGWIKKDKTLPAHKIGKQWKFQLSELDKWVKSGKSEIK